MSSIPKTHLRIFLVLATVTMLSAIATWEGNVVFAQQNDIPSELIDFILHSSKNLGSSILDIGRGVNYHIPSGFENIKEHISSSLDRAQTALDNAIKIDSQNKYKFLAFYIWI